MTIHILRAARVPCDSEKELLAGLDKYQRKYLSRHCCGLCDKQLSQPGCGAYGVWPPEDYACKEDVRIDRIKRCLSEYKPRLNRRKATQDTTERRVG